MNKYILSIDQSTSGTKAILFDKQGRVVHRCTREHRQYYPKPGWVEHDPEEIYQKTLEVINNLLIETSILKEQLTVISITNQRETVVVWDKISGKPVYNAIVWQCQRAEEICKQLKEKSYDKIVNEKTGLVLSPYFSAAKVKWILNNVPGAREKAESGQLMLGTIDSWIIWKLTGEIEHVTDYSNASRTQLFNINTLMWDKDLLEIFTISPTMLPVVKFSDEIFGYTKTTQALINGLPISGVMGDSHAALFGQNCFKIGMAKATYGTGSSIMMNIGKTPLESRTGLVTSIAWGRSKEIYYVFEGNINSTGATIKWLVENLEMIPSSKACEEVAMKVRDNGGVYFVPGFTGLGAPYWASDARAIICGLTMGTNKGHIVRSALESIAYQIKDILDLMVKDSGLELNELRVDGGPTGNDFLMKFQADIIDVKIVRSKIEELSALGSAYMAGLVVGFWESIEQIQSLRKEDVQFESSMESKTRSLLYKGWKDAVKRAL
jgi:glycerol kinase